MTTENLKQLAQWDAANHTTLLVRRSAQELAVTLLRGDGRYKELDPQKVADFVVAMIESSASHSTGSFVMSIDFVAQGTIGPHGPGSGGGPSGDDPPETRLLLQAGAIDVHMQVRGLAERVQLAQLAQLQRSVRLWRDLLKGPNTTPEDKRKAAECFDWARKMGIAVDDA